MSDSTNETKQTDEAEEANNVGDTETNCNENVPAPDSIQSQPLDCNNGECDRPETVLKGEHQTEIYDKLNETITYHQKILEQNTQSIKQLEDKCSQLESIKHELEVKLENVTSMVT